MHERNDWPGKSWPKPKADRRRKESSWQTFCAFRAFRYDLGRVGTLGDVIAPPYDVIDPAFQTALYAAAPTTSSAWTSAARNRAIPMPRTSTARAGGTLRDWLRDDILRQDTARSLYVYHQDFEAEGARDTRKGFLARVRLEPFDKGQIYAHEETMAGPKADRLKLMHATHMNLSPIFGMFPDPKGEVQAKLDAAVGNALALQATDHLGVVSKLWPVTEQSVVSAVTGMMGPKPVFIADGHHRYETSLRYLEERRQHGEVRDADARELHAHDAREHERPGPHHSADASPGKRRTGADRG